MIKTVSKFLIRPEFENFACLICRYCCIMLCLFSGVVGLMFGHVIHDTVFILAMCLALYLVFGRARTAKPEAA
ncbi:MAG: hypothetical protein COA37_09010 [Hoeflea sp.]|uniref:hypothetical protein n=1 Tax=Hoeflea sp. TaxID=1940281 RepID=UPI000C0E4359|nr:hypothetical protein [Hoeflea sp.]PHR23444.1 MAG: hypothetical protein COA37_09010 [Hoeflea sp.]